ncbi:MULTISPECIES: DUF2071 domain-containing protein [Altibacter]|uniref:YqjF family protein n=1 Tax=Altibacter TaxID=1535231 RepID=UPI000558C800|nr:MULTISPECIES: DUF2071 domain-containing protein [Altibacter]MCW8980545.1 DUF2071 domain-containing protein [Altibacter sp.]MCW9036972.1 DUF2071 domain-containing protein [Altibacter sp.]
MSFLTAEWRKLLLANYEVPPSLLTKYLPFGTELDLWKGRCYVSMVGFLFVNTRLRGLKIPYHTTFEEVNLRFYVKREEMGQWKRGVVFVKEIVPKPAITWVANTFYKERYETHPMKHVWNEDKSHLEVSYHWRLNSGWQFLQGTAEANAKPIEPGSEAEFITEHYWGYAQVNDHTTNEYEVTHPRWLQYPILTFESNIDFTANYGPAFAMLNQQEPISVMLAEGSAITVESKKQIS